MRIYIILYIHGTRTRVRPYTRISNINIQIRTRTHSGASIEYKKKKKKLRVYEYTLHGPRTIILYKYSITNSTCTRVVPLRRVRDFWRGKTKPRRTSTNPPGGGVGGGEINNNIYLLRVDHYRIGVEVRRTMDVKRPCRKDNKKKKKKYLGRENKKTTDPSAVVLSARTKIVQTKF